MYLANACNLKRKTSSSIKRFLVYKLNSIGTFSINDEEFSNLVGELSAIHKLNGVISSKDVNMIYLKFSCARKPDN